jgi:hypothetical protein
LGKTSPEMKKQGKTMMMMRKTSVKKQGQTSATMKKQGKTITMMEKQGKTSMMNVSQNRQAQVMQLAGRSSRSTTEVRLSTVVLTRARGQEALVRCRKAMSGTNGQTLQSGRQSARLQPQRPMGHVWP